MSVGITSGEHAMIRSVETLASGEGAVVHSAVGFGVVRTGDGLGVVGFGVGFGEGAADVAGAAAIVTSCVGAALLFRIEGKADGEVEALALGEALETSGEGEYGVCGAAEYFWPLVSARSTPCMKAPTVATPATTTAPRASPSLCARQP